MEDFHNTIRSLGNDGSRCRAPNSWLLAGTPDDGDPGEWEGEVGTDPGEDEAGDGSSDLTELDVSTRARTKARPNIRPE